MKQYAVIATLILGGCATTGSGPVAGSGNVGAQVQQYATIYCGFEPTIATVTEIIATFGGPGVVAAQALAEQIAKAICNAVVPPKTAEGWGGLTLASYQVAAQPPPKKKPTVNGVPVHGRFVK